MSLCNKRQEITEYAKERVTELAEYNPDVLNDVGELHHEIFNTDYYIIGRYQAKEWLGADTFDCIGAVQEYEQDNFGETYTDISEPEKVVNMYVYVIGEEILQGVVDDYQANVQLELITEEDREFTFPELIAYGEELREGYSC
jgi:hypothetical protein